MKKERKIEEELRDTKIEVSYASVYSALGFKDHEEMTTKANLVMELSRAIKKKKLTQTQAAEIFKISQPKLSEILRGRFRGYSVERLIHFLNLLGQDVDIVVRPKPRSREARVNVYHFSHGTSMTTSVPAKRI